jgi:hypothetical protein
MQIQNFEKNALAVVVKMAELVASSKFLKHFLLI